MISTSQIGLNQAQTHSTLARPQHAQEPDEGDRKPGETVEHVANSTHQILVTPPADTEVPTQTAGVEVVVPPPSASITPSSTTLVTSQTDVINPNCTLVPSSQTVDHSEQQAVHHPTSASTPFTLKNGTDESIGSRPRPLVILNRLPWDSEADYRLDHHQKLQLDLDESGVITISSADHEPTPIVSTTARHSDMHNGSRQTGASN